MTFRLTFLIFLFVFIWGPVFSQDEETEPAPSEEPTVEIPNAEVTAAPSEEIVEEKTTQEENPKEEISPAEETPPPAPTPEIIQTPIPTAKKDTTKDILTDLEIAPLKVKKKKEEEPDKDVYVQQNANKKLPSNYKTLDLNSAIEQGLRQNPDEEIRNLRTEFYDLEKQSYSNAFWLPHVTLSLQTDPQRLGLIKKGGKPGLGTSKAPAGNLALSLGEYTVFNWGKDYLRYRNQLETLSRKESLLKEDRRDLRHEIISNFYSLIAVKNIEKIARTELRQASFVFRLNKERLSAGKTSKHDYLESRSAYLLAQTHFSKASLDIEVIEGKLNELLGDPRGTSYVLSQDILIKKIALPLDEATSFSKLQNKDILTAKTNLEIAKNEYDLLKRESLPLPKLSINLGAYTNRFSKNEAQTAYETSPNNSDLELVAQINATWDILGPNGPLNETLRSKAQIQKEISMHELNRSENLAETLVREIYSKILFIENKYLLVTAQVTNAQKSFDNLVDNYVNKRGSISDLRRSLDELSTSSIEIEKIKEEHVKLKILLSKTIGMDDLPGESFEKLVTRVKK